MSFAAIPPEAIDTCLDLARTLKSTAQTRTDRIRGTFVYRAYLRALAANAEPARTAKWRYFVRALRAYLARNSGAGSPSGSKLWSILEENADLLIEVSRTQTTIAAR